jgi:hypothetical protein
MAMVCLFSVLVGQAPKKVVEPNHPYRGLLSSCWHEMLRESCHLVVPLFAVRQFKAGHQSNKPTLMVYFCKANVTVHRDWRIMQLPKQMLKNQ